MRITRERERVNNYYVKFSERTVPARNFLGTYKCKHSNMLDADYVHSSRSALL